MITPEQRQQLLNKASVVANETEDSANDANRIGTLFADIVRALGDGLSEEDLGNIILRLCAAHFLSKTSADTAAGRITFEAGINAMASSMLNNISVSGTAAFEQIQSDGPIHADGNITSDSNVEACGKAMAPRVEIGQRSNGVWTKSGEVYDEGGECTAIFDYLIIRKAAHFFKLVIDELKSQQGAVIITAANCEIDFVEVDGETHGYRVYFRAGDGSRQRVNGWEVGDGAIRQAFEAGKGVSQNWRTKYYWRRVLAVSNTPVTTKLNGDAIDDEGNEYHWIVLGNDQGQHDGTDAPAAGDHLVQLGYEPPAQNPLTGSALAARQSAIIISAYTIPDTDLVPPIVAMYRGIDNFSLAGTNGEHRKTFIHALGSKFTGDFEVVSGNTVMQIDRYVNALASDVANIATSRLKLRDEGCQMMATLPTTSYPDGRTAYTLRLYVIYEQSGSGDIIPLGQLDTKGIDAYLRYRIVYTDSAGAWSEVYLNEYEGQDQGWDGEIIHISATLDNTASGEANHYTHLKGIEVLLTEDDASAVYDSLFIPFLMETGASFVINQALGQVRSTVSRHNSSISTLEQNADYLMTHVSGAEGKISQISQTADNISMSVRGNGLAGTNLLQKPELSQANVTGTGTPWLTSTDTSATAAFVTQVGEDGGEEHIMQVDLTSITPTSGKKFDLRQSVKGVVEPLTTYVASIYVRNRGYSQEHTNLFGVMMEWVPYISVADPTGKNPAAEGWYERSNRVYVLTADTQAVSGKTYYIKVAALVEFIGSGYTGSNVTQDNDTTDGQTWARRLFKIEDQEWHRVWAVFRLSSIVPTESITLTFRAHISGNKSGSKWQIELPKLEEGAVPTAWSATSDALKRAGIDITRGKIRLDAETVEVAEDLTIGGHTRIGGFTYNLPTVINTYGQAVISVVNPFGRGDLMDDYMQGQDVSSYLNAGEVKASYRIDVLRFPECGANVVYDFDDDMDLVLPFAFTLQPAVALNPCTNYTSSPWLLSEYSYLEQMLRYPKLTALPYVGSRMMLRTDGEANGSLAIYGMKGFGKRSFTQSPYALNIYEYDPWGYYTTLWRLTDITVVADYVTREMAVNAIDSVRHKMFTYDGSMTGTYSVAGVYVANGITATISFTRYAGAHPFLLTAGMHVLLRCIAQDGNVFWAIEDCGTI